MASAWGNNIKISIFGESHGLSIGVVIDGLPSGAAINEEALYAFMARRAPGNNAFSTQRKEEDRPQIQSGLYRGRTTGTPLCAVIENSDTRSADYGDMARLARPSHADYTGHVRYRGFNDVRGGGHFSGRLTAPLVLAGGIAGQILEARGIAIGGHIARIRHIGDNAPDSLLQTRETLGTIADKPFPVFDDAQGDKMRAEIEAARQKGDSVGGVIACYALGVPAGIGSPMFDGVENVLSSLLFAIPAVKGVAFGSGFEGSMLSGSENNDAMRMEDGNPAFESNRHGGAIGGITSGAPLYVRAALKPTPSISIPQRTVDYIRGEDADITVKGRHDPCIVPRAVPCVEACVALGILDMMMEGAYQWI
jgi:chorismate synthase